MLFSFNSLILENKIKMKVFIYSLIICLFAASCTTNQKTTQTVSNEHNSENSLDWDGIYRGVLPCADCEGLLTTVYLQKDLSFTIKYNYLGKPAGNFEQKGKFKWNTQGSQIVLQPNDNSSPTIFSVGEGIITQLDQEGNKITGDLANNFILSKAAFSIYERYWKLVELNGKAVTTSDAQRKEPHIIFKNDQKVIGNGGCNGFGGTFELLPLNRLKLSQVVATEMACNDMNIESEFFSVLQMVDSFTVDGDDLTLTKAKMTPLAKFKSVVMK